MKQIPADPVQQHARMISAFCDDLMAGDYSAPRTKAAVEISKQTRERGGSNVALANQ